MVATLLIVVVHLFLFAASKHPRLAIEQAVEDVLPLSVAQKFRDRLKEQQMAEASTSSEDAEKRKTRGKKVDHLYTRSTTKFVNCLKELTPRQKEAVEELGFGAMLHYNISEIPGYITYWVLNSLNLARC